MGTGIQWRRRACWWKIWDLVVKNAKKHNYVFLLLGRHLLTSLLIFQHPSLLCFLCSCSTVIHCLWLSFTRCHLLGAQFIHMVPRLLTWWLHGWILLHWGFIHMVPRLSTSLSQGWCSLHWGFIHIGPRLLTWWLYGWTSLHSHGAKVIHLLVLRLVFTLLRVHSHGVRLLTWWLLTWWIYGWTSLHRGFIHMVPRLATCLSYGLWPKQLSVDICSGMLWELNS